VAFKTDKAYTYNKSQRLAIIREDIKKLISDTLRKKRVTPEPETFKEWVKPPPLSVYTADVLKPEKDSLRMTWVFESPPMTEAN